MNLSYLLASAILFLFARAKKGLKKSRRGLPPAAGSETSRPRLEDASVRDEDEEDEEDEDDDRDYDDSILDSVWEGQGVESDEYARNAADLAYKQAISDGFHPLVADAKSLDEYDARGGQSPWYIEKKQALIGADPTGEFDEQTQTRCDLIIAAAELVKQSAPKPSALPSAASSQAPTQTNSQMFELKEPADWDLTPVQRGTHAEARKAAIKEYQKARANGQTHQVGAAMWLGVYMKMGGTRKETIYMMQRECGMPYEWQTAVWDQNTKDWVKRTTADYRAWLSGKK